MNLGEGQSILLVTDQTASRAVATGELLGGAAALVLSYDLDEVAAVQPIRDRRSCASGCAHRPSR